MKPRKGKWQKIGRRWYYVQNFGTFVVRTPDYMIPARFRPKITHG